MEPVTPAEEVKGETPIYRAAGMKAEGNHLLNFTVSLSIFLSNTQLIFYLDPLTDCFTNGEKDLNKMIENSVREFANNPLLGTRVMTEGTEEDAEGNSKCKSCPFTNLAIMKAGKYQWMTYVEVYEKAKFLARAINAKELCPDITGEDGVQ